MVATLRRIALLILPSLAAAPAAGAQERFASVSEVEYEGWRQYSVHCARCHGQDALPNPVAANLLTSLAPDGPAADQKTFTTVVIEGRTSRGMPAFKGSLEPSQVEAIYHYLKGRAEKRIPPGRPKTSGS
ncbi:MAG TPA: cytochrome c [Gemmatimonadales bacterium]|nr:cytochrome c [Gemmatimonadales bacterium]